jgi:glutamate-5-semialdehyde dehydrogenase
MLNLEKYINLIIPRGSNELVKFIQENTRIPVLGHADGICHLFIDIEADLEMALSVSLDSKIQYPAACNAIETLLVHKDIASAFLEKAIPLFKRNDVKLIGDKRSVELGLKYEATLEDWQTEYLDLILSIKIVDDLEEAITHIQKYSSKHTDGIITENSNTANKFMNIVDSAGVFHNCSTRFADGFRYGFGAEVGISTQTLPPRGPVGLEGLVTYKYFLKGDGNIVDDFSKGKAIYTHKDL